MSRVHAPWLLAWAGLLALTTWVYLPALSGPLLLDDHGVIEPLLAARADGQPWRDLLISNTGPLGRPVAMASFIGNAVASADLRTWKATNLALHLLTGVLLGALVVTVARAARPSLPAAPAGLLVAALWLLHPLQVSTVMYLAQRMTQLATLFGLLALLLHARGRERGAETRAGRTLILVAWFVAAPLAAFAKESGLLTPYLLAALEFTVYAERARPRWLRILLPAATLAPAAGALFVLATHWQRLILNPYALRAFGPLERLLTEARVLLDYLGWIVAPRRGALGFHHDDMAIAHWPPTAFTWLALALHLGLLGLMVALRRRLPLVALGLALFYVGHALESSVFPLELAFEHRNYLPSAGVLLALVAALAAGLGARRGLALGALPALLYLGVTVSMTPTWGDAGRLYAAMHTAHPHSPRARAQLVEWLLAQRRSDLAEAVLGDDQDAAARLHRLRLACLREGHADPASALAAAARLARPDDMSLEILLWLAERGAAACGIEQGALLTALEAVRDRPMSTPTRLRLYVHTLKLRLARGEFADAAKAAEIAMRIAPRDPMPRYLAAEVALAMGDRAAGRRWLDEGRVLAREQRADFAQIEAGLARALDAPR
ncbi:MAG: hypothetical protein K2Y51_04565 [Gammaproteobacteria bacterium]|nr:hypothetical protein [Gammaproteobacteria bacterium]